MLYFFTQGYGCTALILFFLYCVHTGLRSYYVKLAKTANILIWFFSLVWWIWIFLMVICIRISIQVNRFLNVNIIENLTALFFSPLTVIIIGLLFKKIRSRPVWILLPCACLLNINIFIARPDTIFFAEFAGTDLQNTTSWQWFILFGIFFLLLTLITQYLAGRVKKNIAREENHMPHRI